jgi:hypothetical protein
MSNETTIHVIVGVSAVVGLAAYIGLILVPAWTTYTRLWHRLAAAFLTLYIAAAAALLGVAGGAAIVWFWDRIHP